MREKSQISWKEALEEARLRSSAASDDEDDDTDNNNHLTNSGLSPLTNGTVSFTPHLMQAMCLMIQPASILPTQIPTPTCLVTSAQLNRQKHLVGPRDN